MQSDLEWCSGDRKERLPESALPAREKKEGGERRRKETKGWHKRKDDRV